MSFSATHALHHARSELHNAAEAGDAELVAKLLSSVTASGGKDFNPVRSRGGETACNVLRLACVSPHTRVGGAQGEQEEEEEEEKEEPNVDARDEYGCTPLHLALLNGACAHTDGGAPLVSCVVSTYVPPTTTTLPGD